MLCETTKEQLGKDLRLAEAEVVQLVVAFGDDLVFIDPHVAVAS